MADYGLTTPCANCPFRTDIKPYITSERCEEILNTQGEFPCHKTIRLGDPISDDDENWCEIEDESKAQVCAGFLIVLENEERPNQMMRIAERLGAYDASKLRMDAPVYGSVDEAIEAHEAAERPRVRRKRSARQS